jgi:uncharacterized membrane protein
VLRRGEGGDSRVTSIAFSSGLLFAAFAAAFFVPVAAGASANEFDDRAITREVAETLWVLGNGIFGVAEITAGVLALATAIVVFRSAVLPKWYGWLGGLYGVWLLILPIGWIGMIGLPIWILLTTLLVWNAETKTTAAAGAAV